MSTFVVLLQDVDSLYEGESTRSHPVGAHASLPAGSQAPDGGLNPPLVQVQVGRVLAKLVQEGGGVVKGMLR